MTDERFRTAIVWLLTEMPVGWETIAEAEGRGDVVAVCREVAEVSP